MNHDKYEKILINFLLIFLQIIPSLKLIVA